MLGRWCIFLLLSLSGVNQMNQQFGGRFEIPTNGRLHRIEWAAVEPTLTQPVDGYRIYWARPGEEWKLLHEVQSHITEWQFDSEALPPGLVLFVVTAFNVAGDSTTEHGTWAGEGYFPEP